MGNHSDKLLLLLLLFIHPVIYKSNLRFVDSLTNEYNYIQWGLKSFCTQEAKNVLLFITGKARDIMGLQLYNLIYCTLNTFALQMTKPNPLYKCMWIPYASNKYFTFRPMMPSCKQIFLMASVLVMVFPLPMNWEINLHQRISRSHLSPYWLAMPGSRYLCVLYGNLNILLNALF